MSVTIKVPKGTRLFVIGDIHEHLSQFYQLNNEIQPSADKWLVSVGDLYDKGPGIEAAEELVDQFRDLSNQGVGYIIQGNHELKHIRKAKRGQGKMTSQLSWMDQQPLTMSFEFSNRARVTIVHGGVTPHHTWHDLAYDVESCYVRWVDEAGKHVRLKKTTEDGIRVMKPAREGVVWHEKYCGRFGYIVSGHNAQKDGIPKYYDYSCNIDTACYHTGKLIAQEITEKGTLGEALVAQGPAQWPVLEDLFRSWAQEKKET